MNAVRHWTPPAPVACPPSLQPPSLQPPSRLRWPSPERLKACMTPPLSPCVLRPGGWRDVTATAASVSSSSVQCEPSARKVPLEGGALSDDLNRQPSPRVSPTAPSRREVISGTNEVLGRASPGRGDGMRLGASALAQVALEALFEGVESQKAPRGVVGAPFDVARPSIAAIRGGSPRGRGRKSNSPHVSPRPDTRFRWAARSAPMLPRGNTVQSRGDEKRGSGASPAPSPTPAPALRFPLSRVSEDGASVNEALSDCIASMEDAVQRLSRRTGPTSTGSGSDGASTSSRNSSLLSSPRILARQRVTARGIEALPQSETMQQPREARKHSPAPDSSGSAREGSSAGLPGEAHMSRDPRVPDNGVESHLPRDRVGGASSRHGSSPVHNGGPRAPAPPRLRRRSPAHEVTSRRRPPTPIDEAGMPSVRGFLRPASEMPQVSCHTQAVPHSGECDEFEHLPSFNTSFRQKSADLESSSSTSWASLVVAAAHNPMAHEAASQECGAPIAADGYPSPQRQGLHQNAQRQGTPPSAHHQGMCGGMPGTAGWRWEGAVHPPVGRGDPQWNGELLDFNP